MLPLEIGLQVLSILASFASGCWLGRSRCHIAFEVQTEEQRKAPFPCLPWSKHVSPWSKQVSDKDKV